MTPVRQYIQTYMRTRRCHNMQLHHKHKAVAKRPFSSCVAVNHTLRICTVDLKKHLRQKPMHTFSIAIYSYFVIYSSALFALLSNFFHDNNRCIYMNVENSICAPTSPCKKPPCERAAWVVQLISERRQTRTCRRRCRSTSLQSGVRCCVLRALYVCH